MNDPHKLNQSRRTALALGALTLVSPLAFPQGVVDSWGWGAYGHDLPGAEFSQVVAGTEHSIGLRTDGSLLTSGFPFSDLVVDTPSESGFVQVAAGERHSMALRFDGSLWSWGADDGGTLDYGQVTNTPTDTDFVSVACGGYFSLALRTDGSIAAWGADYYGAVSTAPTEAGFVQISAGNDHCLALRADGSIVAWGYDWDNMVSDTPTEVGFTQVSAGTANSLALRADGSIAVWGNAGHPAINPPTEAGFTRVVCGMVTAMALRPDGSILSWGSDNDGLISTSPVGTGYTDVAAGWAHAVGIRPGNPGSAYCFGDGTGANCPCSNFGGLNQGCANSGGSIGARLIGVGDSSMTNASFELRVIDATPNTLGLMLRGTEPVNRGLGNPAGDGLLCVGGFTVRSQVQSATAGFATFTNFHGTPIFEDHFGAGNPSHYQFWFRDSGNQCTNSGFNFSNAWKVDWVQ